MENRVYCQRKTPMPVALLVCTVLSLPLAALLTLLISSLSQLDPSKQQLNYHLDYRLAFAGCYAIVFLASIVSFARSRMSKARVAINDSALLEYDRYGRLLVRAELDSITMVEKVRLVKHDAYFVHFSNGQLAIIGQGLEGFPELRRLVLSRIQTEPTERRFDDLGSLMKVVNNRPVLKDSS